VSGLSIVFSFILQVWRQTIDLVIFSANQFSSLMNLPFSMCASRFPIEDSLLAQEPPPEVPLSPRPKAEGNGLSIALQVPLVALEHEEEDEDEVKSAEGDSETEAAVEEDDDQEDHEERKRGATATSSKRGTSRHADAAADESNGSSSSSSSSSSAQKKKKERQQQLLVDNQEELLARAEALKASADALAWKREWCVEGAEVVHETYGTGTVASVGAAWIWVRFDDRAVMKKAKSKVCCTARRDKRRALREGRMVWLCSQTLHLKLSKHLKF